MQNAKAEALGPRHNIALLPQVAAEPWLSRVIQDAAAAEEAGWFWHYRLNGLKARRPLSGALRPLWHTTGPVGVMPPMLSTWLGSVSTCLRTLDSRDGQRHA